jgi:glycosyltransferase involved in cell wall biosynthesis
MTTANINDTESQRVPDLVSVVVPTKNSAEHLGQCLESLRNQTYPHIELIVVDNFSSDNTHTIALMYTQKVFQCGPERSAQVNFGARMAAGEYIYKVDSDFVLDEQVVEQCVREMSKGHDAIVVHNTPDARVSWIARIRKFEVDMYKYDLAHSSARFVRKDVFFRIGGFNEQVTAGEDYDFQNRLNRAGCSIGFVDAEALHLGEPPRFLPHMLRYFAYGQDFVHYRDENRVESASQLGFMRPIYLRNWKKFLRQPALGLGFSIYHLCKFGFGSAGYLSARFATSLRRNQISLGAKSQTNSSRDRFAFVRSGRDDLRSMAGGSVICLLWRPSGSVLRDGGFRRTYSILNWVSESAYVVLIDRAPSPVSFRGHGRVIEYHVPRILSRLEPRVYPLARVMELAIVMGQLLRLGRTELRRNPHPIIYVPTSELWWVSLPAHILARVYGRRLILVPLNTAGGGIAGWLNWRIHARADGVIAISRALRSDLAKRSVIDRVWVNGVGFVRAPARGPTPFRSRHHSAIYVGRIRTEKGLDDNLAAWALVISSLPQSDLVLVGHATPAAIRRFNQLSGRLRLQKCVSLRGVVAEDEKLTLLSGSKICLFLSRAEGWGIVPVEALSLGVPVVVYDLPCYADSLRGLKGVHVVPEGDFKAAANCVVRLLSLREGDYDRMSTEIAASFHYETWDRVAYRELCILRGESGEEYASPVAIANQSKR